MQALEVQPVSYGCVDHQPKHPVPFWGADVPCSIPCQKKKEATRISDTGGEVKNEPFETEGCSAEPLVLPLRSAEKQESSSSSGPVKNNCCPEFSAWQK